MSISVEDWLIHVVEFLGVIALGAVGYCYKMIQNIQHQLDEHKAEANGKYMTRQEIKSEIKEAVEPLHRQIEKSDNKLDKVLDILLGK